MPELIPAEPGTPEWLAARRAGVTATDIVTILGLSHRDSQYSLFWRKLGQVPEVEDSDRFRLGRELEPYVVERWFQADGRLPMPGGLFRSIPRPWQLATLDRRLEDSGRKIVGVLEVKSWADADRHSWQDAPPPQVRAQVLWQMDVMDAAAGHVGVVFLPSGEFRSYTLEHDESPVKEYPHDVPGRAWSGCELCVDQILMREAGEEFMARLRLELPPPDPDSSAATLAAVRARFARVPAKQAEIDGTLYAAWSDTKDLMASYAFKLFGYEAEIREQAGEAAEYTVDGQVVARRVVSDAPVKAHVRHQDYIRRIKQGDDSE